MEAEPLEIFIRHATEERWCNYRGDWLPRRQSAISFTSNVDALHFCRMFHVQGVLVTFGRTGTEVYRVPVEMLLGTRLAANVHTRDAEKRNSA
jgi:hypothetical protein